MLRYLRASLCFLPLLAAQARTLEVTGPSGSVQFRLSTDPDGQLTYSVAVDGAVRLAPARLGLLVDGADLGTEAELDGFRARTISELFPWRGQKNQATNHCRAYEIPVRSGPAGTEWTLEVRVFEDGVGFRYRVPGDGERKVNGESTEWNLPPDSTLWFQTDTTNYEGVYQSARADQVPLEVERENKLFSVYLGPPVTVAFQNGGFGLVSEAALYNYSGLTLRPTGGARFQAAFQDDPDGWVHRGPILSPWRVFVVTKDLDALVNSDLIPSLCEPADSKLFPAGLHTSWIRPGKAPCTWMVFGNDGAQWHRQKGFVDTTAAMGSEYLLVDAGWRTERWGWLKEGGDLWARTAELCRYAATKNVGIILWHGYPEGRDDGPGLTTVAAREELFRHCQQAGVKGIKIDFFDSESKAVVEAYEDLLRRSAKYQLMINFHGANKPTGEPRTWPHEITREGIREQEYVLWSSLPLSHYGALPFTRMAVGHADFLPGYVQPRFLKNTTAVFQMAAVIVFSSPFLCWPDSPEAYLESPFLSFVRTVPVTWDETRVLAGSKIGETVLLARRNEASWYIAALNCRPEPQSLELDLSFADLAGKELTVYRDGPTPVASVIESGLTPPTDGKVQIALLPGGGWIGCLAPPKRHAGWR